MQKNASVGARKTEVTAIVFSPCKNCGKGTTGPGSIETAHRLSNPDCPGYEPSYPARHLGLVAGEKL